MLKEFFLCVQEREEAYQRELEAAKIEKEKEIARLRAQQERAKDKQAEKVCCNIVVIFQPILLVEDLHFSLCSID